MHEILRMGATNRQAAIRDDLQSVPPTPPNPVDELFKEVTALSKRLTEFETSHRALMRRVSNSNRASARNLLHYVALRQHDVRMLQDRLSRLGLSSLGRCEAHVQATIDAVRGALGRMRGVGLDEAACLPVTFDEGARLLAERSAALLGPIPAHRAARIMVTVPSEAAEVPALIEEMLRAGMDIMRINCAHDDAQRWSKMVEHLEGAKKRLKLPCRILMDIGGPKLRTGELEAIPAVIRIRPERDSMGRIVSSGRVWLYDEAKESPRRAGIPSVPVSRTWLDCLTIGTKISLTDLRQRRRRLVVLAVGEEGVWAECPASCHLGNGVELTCRSNDGGAATKATVISALRPVQVPLVLSVGDTLRLVKALAPGRPALRDSQGRVLDPARIACTLPEAFAQARPGQRIIFDDGKIEGIIRAIEPETITVDVTRTAKARTKLGADKGINLPDTTLAIDALTSKDLTDLQFIVEHADLLGMSFVRNTRDVAQLERALGKLHATPDFGVVFKLETREAFNNLPRILLAAMTGRPIGIMIARGDLAIECGWVRMTELQEEILWVSEAAHVPAIWATQVLETLAKKGVPSRAELTDATMGGRAECVMLNKGPHIVSAIRTLDDILSRMQNHQSKKTPRLRMLHLAERIGVSVNAMRTQRSITKPSAGTAQTPEPLRGANCESAARVPNNKVSRR
jgi:pyruvate kinase